MKRFLPALASVLLLSACSVGDDYARPDLPAPSAWKNQEPVPATPAWPSAGWWKNFNAPSLDRMMQEAEGANLDITASMARVRQADDTLRSTGAALLPAVNANAGGTRQRAPYGAAAGTNATRAFVGNSFNLGLSASYEIDFWGKNRAAQDAAAAAAFQSRFDLRTMQLGIQADIAGTLFDLLGARERLAVAHESVTGAEKILDAIRHQRRGGMATALDEAQQESQVESQRAAIPPLEQQIEQDRNALALLLGKMGDEMGPLPETLDQIALPVVTAGLPSDLLARRPDVGSAEQQLVAANANITVARAQLFPDITLTGSAGFQSIDLLHLVQHAGMLDSLSGSVAQIIFDGDRLESQVDFSRDRYAELLAFYRKTVISAFLDVENALIGLQKSADSEKIQRAYFQQAAEANRISERLLNNSMIDIVTLLNTQRSYYGARDSLVLARTAHLQAILGLYRALGGGWEAGVAP